LKATASSRWFGEAALLPPSVKATVAEAADHRQENHKSRRASLSGIPVHGTFGYLRIVEKRWPA